MYLQKEKCGGDRIIISHGFMDNLTVETLYITFAAVCNNN